MKKILTLIALLLIIVACKTTKTDLHSRYILKDFNFNAANAFVKQIDTLKQIDKISITDLEKTGREFKVNGQHIFTDTTLTDKPNFYNYKKRAAEIKVQPEKLLTVLKSFYAIKAEEFERTDSLYIFEVEGYLNYRKGFIHSPVKHFTPGDSVTIRIPVYITRQVDSTWYEYKS